MRTHLASAIRRLPARPVVATCLTTLVATLLGPVALGAQDASTHTASRAAGWLGLGLLKIALPIVAVVVVAAFVARGRRGSRAARG